ncbi:hypothetical protein BDV18DRAFT_159440 [Aspergillus unguis]
MAKDLETVRHLSDAASRTTKSLCRSYHPVIDESSIRELQKVLPLRYHHVLQDNGQLFSAVFRAVRKHMARYDLSHDIRHILRVLALAGRILDAEDSDTKYNAKTIFLSALLHDIPDPKYTPPGQNPTAALTSILHNSGASPSLMITITTIATHISYRRETRDPASVQRVLLQYPELAIVQDADRLDALGAIGIARVFAFGGAMRPGTGLESCLEYLGERGEGVEALMKTSTGREMARERARRIKEYRKWWEEEMNL